MHQAASGFVQATPSTLSMTAGAVGLSQNTGITTD